MLNHEKSAWLDYTKTRQLPRVKKGSIKLSKNIGQTVDTIRSLCMIKGTFQQGIQQYTNCTIKTKDKSIRKAHCKRTGFDRLNELGIEFVRKEDDPSNFKYQIDL